MERYKFVFPNTHQYACPLSTGDHSFMAESGDGTWVMFDDALARSRKEFDKGKAEGKLAGIDKYAAAQLHAHGYQKGLDVGLASGRAEGQTKLEAYIASREDEVYRPALTFKPDALPSKVDQRLLNELYHDRARLERVVTDAVDLLKAVEEYLDGKDLRTKDLLDGMVVQFIDTHGERV